MEAALGSAVDTAIGTGYLPAQCIVSGLNGFRCRADTLRVEITDSRGESRTAEYDCSRTGPSACPVPIPAASLEGKLYVSFKAFKDSGEVSRFETELPSFGPDSYLPGSPFSQDSLYIRSMPGSRLVGRSDFVETAGRDSARIYCGEGLPKLEEALAYMESLYGYFSGFRTVRTSSGPCGTAKIGTVIDLTETREGTVESQGLLFSKTAGDLGLEPVVLLSRNRCICGIKTGISGGAYLNSVPLLHTVSACSDFPFPLMNIGTYILAEFGTGKPLDEAMESASYFNEFQSVCLCPELMKKKIERLENTVLPLKTI